MKNRNRPERGLDVLEGIAGSRSRKEIASELGISDRAVEGRMGTMLENLRKRVGKLGPVPEMDCLRLVDTPSKIVRGKVVRRAVKWVGRAERPADTSPASVPDRGGLKESVGGLESDVVGAAADVGLSADASIESAGEGGRLKNVGGGLKKSSVESDDARFQSAENGVRVDDIDVGLKNVGVETADAEFQSADVGVRLKDIGGGLEDIGGRHENISGGLETIGAESDASRFQSADVGVGLKHVGVGLKNIGVGLKNIGVGLKNIGGRSDNIGVGLETIGGGLKNIGVETTDAGFQSDTARFQSSASLFRLSNNQLHSEAQFSRQEVLSDSKNKEHGTQEPGGACQEFCARPVSRLSGLSRS